MRVAQLDRASDYGSEGREFESSRARCEILVDDENRCRDFSMYIFFMDGMEEQMAQLEQLQKIVGAENVKEQELMSAHTTFRIGGPADFMVEPQTEEAMIRVIAYCQQ